MFTMQVFHEWLSSAAVKSNAYQRLLVRLTQASRIQILNYTSAVQWYIWSADKAANAQ